MSKKLPKDRYFYIKDVECTTTISYTTRKELLGLLDNIINNRYDTFEFMEDDGACFHIIYKDGTDDIVNMFYDGHKIKRINIASIVYTDATENLVYGNFEVSECGSVSASLTEKIDNTNVVEVDREYKFETLEIADAEPVEPAEKDIDYTLMSDNDLHDVVFGQLDYINRDLMETCVYNELNGNGKYVHVSDNDFMDVTPALAEYNRRFGTTEIFCLIYRHFESRKTHVEYDSFDDTMYIVEVIPYDDDGNIIEYGYYVGDYYVRYSGVTENIEIVEVNENEPETTNETKNEKEVKKAMEKTKREFKVNNTTYLVVNNQNYNKEFAFEPNSMKYYAMKLLTTDNTTKSWVKTGITGNTIVNVKEKVKEWEDFMKYVDNYDSTKTAEIVEPVEPTENAEPVHITIDNNTPDLVKSVIELEKVKKFDNVISEKSKEFLKEFNALSKDIIENTVNNVMETIENAESVEPVEPVEPDKYTNNVNVDINSNYPVKDTNSVIDKIYNTAFSDGIIPF